MSYIGMMGIECCGITWQGKRVHVNSHVNEFGGFLTTDEAKHWTVQFLKDYTQWQNYEKVEIWGPDENKEPHIVETIYSKDLVGENRVKG